MFLTLLLPAASHYCLTTMHNKVVKQYDCKTIEQVRLGAAKAASQGKDVFVGLAGFNEGWHKVGEKNVFRTTANAKNAKALWLDVDIGGEGKYQSVKDAADALVNFCNTIRLPAPTVVSSGGGLHLYWFLQQQVTADVWGKLSNGLRAVTQHCGFKADHARTTDITSMPRVPGTRNFKSEYGPAGREVKLVTKQENIKQHDVRVIAKILSDFIKTYDVNVRVQQRKEAPLKTEHDALFAKAFSNVMDDKTIIDAKPVILGCEQIRTAGRSTEAVWFNMMLAMKHTAQGVQAVRAISKTDQRYNETDMLAKYEHAQSLDGGPTLCSTFDALQPGICQRCPNYKLVKTPVSLGRVQKHHEHLIMAAPQEPDRLMQPEHPKPESVHTVDIPRDIKESSVPLADLLPRTAPYEIRPGKGVILHLPTDPLEGTRNSELIMDFCLFPVVCQIVKVDRYKEKRIYIWRLEEAGKQPRYVRTDAEDILSANALLVWSHGNGLVSPPYFEKKRLDFMKTYLAHVQNKMPKVRVCKNFGWADAVNEDGRKELQFNIGERLVSKSASDSEVCVHDNLEEFANKRLVRSGSLEEWKKIPQFYGKHNILWGQMAVCAAFAAPLMRFAPHTTRNGILNFWSSDSGTGKTTAQRVINSVWGSPQELLLNVHSTNNSRYKMMGWLRNIPICIDEVTKMSDEELSDALFTMSEGVEKDRMNSGGGLQESGEWNSLIVMSANRSAMDKMAFILQQRDAEVKRVIDIEVDKCEDARDDAVAMGRVMENNYGLAGAEFVHQLLQIPDMERKMQKLIDDWCAKHSTSQSERYWMSTIACIVVAGALAKKFGLIDYDIKALEEYAMSHVKKMRTDVIGCKSSGEALLADFLMENVRNTLKVASEKRSATSDPNMPPQLDQYIINMPNGDLDVRIEADTNTAYVKAAELKTWLDKRNIPLKNVLNDLAFQGVYDAKVGSKGKVKKRLGAHTKQFADVNCYCYKFNLSKLDLSELVTAPEEADFEEPPF